MMAFTPSFFPEPIAFCAACTLFLAAPEVYDGIITPWLSIVRASSSKAPKRGHERAKHPVTNRLHRDGLVRHRNNIYFAARQ